MPSNGLKSSVDQLSNDKSTDYEGLLMNALSSSKHQHQQQQQQQQFQALSTNGKNKAQHRNKSDNSKIHQAPIWVIFLTYFSYFNLFLFGCLRDFLRSIGMEKKRAATDNNPSVSFKTRKKMSNLFSYFD